MAGANERATKDAYTLSVYNTLDSCSSFSMSRYAKLTVVVPAGSDLTTLAWYGSNDGTNYVALHDPPGSALVSVASAGIGFAAPDGTAGFPFIKIKSSTTDSGDVTVSAQS